MEYRNTLLDFEAKFKMHMNNQAALKACSNYFLEQTNEVDRIMGRNVYWLIEQRIREQAQEIETEEHFKALLNSKRPIQ